jgi:hypothetical protein
MKKLSFVTMIFVFLLLITNGIQGQTAQTKLNQVELMKQWIGTWQGEAGKDTIFGWECKAFGKGVVANQYQIVKGNKTDIAVQCIGYDDRDDKIKGLTLYQNTDFVTFVGMYTTEKLFKMDGLDTFKPEIVWFRNELEFKSPSLMIVRGFNPEGVKTGEWVYTKVK